MELCVGPLWYSVCVCVLGGLGGKNGIENEIMAEREVELSKMEKERERRKRFDRMPLSPPPIMG